MSSKKPVYKVKSTKSVRLNLRMNEPSKQAGCNRLSITVPSTDWRIPNQTISVSVRDAKTIQRFLNDYLED